MVRWSRKAEAYPKVRRAFSRPPEREESVELGQALINESDERVVSEAADVIYHLLVGLVLRKVSLRDLLSELSRRFGTSGHDEKASR